MTLHYPEQLKADKEIEGRESKDVVENGKEKEKEEEAEAEKVEGVGTLLL